MKREIDCIGMGVPVEIRAYPDIDQPYDRSAPWMRIAKNEIGVHEFEGKDKNNPRILEYLRTTTYPNPNIDEIHWCSAFVNWVMQRSGYVGTNSAEAISWLNWGQKLDQPRYGAIVVFPHHVAFYVGYINGIEYILGGNQGNRVKYSPINSYPKPLGFIWPDTNLP